MATTHRPDPATLSHPSPWRNSSPKPASSQEGIGNAGETKRVRGQILAELRRQQEADATFRLPEPIDAKEFDRRTRQVLFHLAFPDIGIDEVIDTWSPGTTLSNAAWEYYRQKQEARDRQAWDRADEWTAIRRETDSLTADSRGGMFKFSGRILSNVFPPSPAWYRLADTPHTIAWAKHALCTRDLLGQPFLDQMSLVEHRRRVHDHIKHRETLQRQQNLERERRVKTVFRRRTRRRATTTEMKKPTVFDRLCEKPTTKVLPDFEAENDIGAMVGAFQSVVKRIVPNLNLRLIKTQPLPEHVAAIARQHVQTSRRLKRLYRFRIKRKK